MLSMSMQLELFEMFSLEYIFLNIMGTIIHQPICFSLGCNASEIRQTKGKLSHRGAPAVNGLS